MTTQTLQLEEATSQLKKLLEELPFEQTERQHYFNMLETQGATPYVIDMIEEALNKVRQAEEEKTNQRLVEITQQLEKIENEFSREIKDFTNKVSNEKSLLAQIRAKINASKTK